MCLVTHEVFADAVEPVLPNVQCRHPFHSGLARPGDLVWAPGGTAQPMIFTYRHPPAHLEIWPQSAAGQACELAGCELPALAGVPLCRRHAALVPYGLVREVFGALEARAGYPRAYASLMRYVEQAREVIEG